LYARGVTEFSFRTRRRNLERMASEEFDLLVIGGGIHGAGVARDAAMRGLTVALVEKGDFASGASSKSSKLIHGGLRYLEHFEFGLVRESCRERGILLRIAPHLVKPLPFLIPIYQGDPRPPWMVRIGLAMYGMLGGSRSAGQNRVLSAAEAVEQEPVLQAGDLRGAAEYWDCQENDARFCLANIVEAAEHGAACANYVEATGFALRGGRLQGTRVRDVITNASFDIRARSFINAGGPWVERIAGLDPATPAIPLRPTKGIHLVTRRLAQRHALLLQTRRDRRVFFVLPWGAHHSLVGTTDTDFDGDADRVEAKCRDVEYLIECVNKALPSVNLTGADVLSSFAGLRPLLRQDGRVPSDVTRRHTLGVSPGGLISIIGGKYTTYRAVAEEVVNLACQRGNKRTAPCRTAGESLALEFPPELISASSQPGFIDAVRQAVDYEMAMSVGDFLFRRTTLGYTEPRREELARRVADEMQKLQGWSEDEKSRQLRRFE
jgi:glycerol-3-phosphate dehydrogenase